MNVYVCELAVGQHWAFPEYITLGRGVRTARTSIDSVEWNVWSRMDICDKHRWLADQFERLELICPIPDGMSIRQLCVAIIRCCENQKVAPSQDVVNTLVANAQAKLWGFGSVKARNLKEWWFRVNMP